MGFYSLQYPLVAIKNKEGVKVLFSKTFTVISLCLIFSLYGCERDLNKTQLAETLGSTDEFQTGAEEFDRSIHPGKTLYENNCAACHQGAVPKAPHFQWLEMMSPTAIFNSMQTGVMRAQAANLSVDEKRLLTEFMTRQTLNEGTDFSLKEPNFCNNRELSRAEPIYEVNWGHDTKRYSPQNVSGLTKADVKKLELKWSFAFPNALRARSQPTISMGAVFVGSQDGRVYAFDLETGCTKWVFSASAEVRTGIVLSAPTDRSSEEGPPLAFFGDLLGRAYAVNALTGELVWSIKTDDHPSTTLTGTPAYHQGVLLIPISSLEVVPAADPNYSCCSFRGSLLAVNGKTGKTKWRHYAIPEKPKIIGKTRLGTDIIAPSGAPIWTSPTIDPKRNLIYVGTGENYSSPAEGNSDAILAIDIETGTRAWTKQTTSGDAWNVACMMADNPNCPSEDGPDYDHGSSILLVSDEDNEDILLAGLKNGEVLGLDPDNEGETIWKTKVGRGSIQGGVHFGMAASDSQVFVPINDMNNTRNGDYLDPVQAKPGLHSLRVNDGSVVWNHVQENVCEPNKEFCDPGISAPVTAVKGAVFAGHLDGFVRAYDEENGELLWSFDTKPERQAVNGVRGKGGGMSGAGPFVADKHVVVNSGYGLYYHEPGNLLLVFSSEN